MNRINVEEKSGSPFASGFKYGVRAALILLFPSILFVAGLVRLGYLQIDVRVIHETQAQ